MTYLIITSFILHFITFFIMIIFMQKLNLKSPIGALDDQEKLKREIEDLLVAYTVEMKEENEKLVNKIILDRKNREQKQLHSLKMSKSPENEANGLKIPELFSLEKQATKKEGEETEFKPPIPIGNEDIVEQSTTAQVLSLANQGFSAKEIAKRLNIGDGEVELLLKFHK